ncbi:metallophosphoesterase [Candidatus Woesearchaeota archaeon]|nr:metallophosphoesterase [Candidatus Woesearchaeota archaeon]
MFQTLRYNLDNPGSKLQWWQITGKKKAKKMIEKSLKDGRRILEFLNSLNVPVYILPGNWDFTGNKSSDWNFLRKDYYHSYLIKSLKNIVDCHHKKIKIKGYEFIGHGIISGPEFPQNKKDFPKDKKELVKKRKEYVRQYKKVDELFKKAKSPVIFLSHNVPYNTPLDKIVNLSSPRNGQHFGSIIARKMIEKYNPLVCIGGHMHEHFGKCKLSKTTVINAGFGSYVNTLLELEGNKIKKLKFYNNELVNY